MRDLSVRYNPIYWLGNSFRGLALTDAKLDGEAAVLSYGPSSCEPSGCTAPPLVISTFAGRQRHFFPPIDYPPAKRSLVCADDVRGGVLIQDCRNERHPSVQTGNFYTGGQYRGVGLEINHYIPHLTIAELARSVVPIEDEPGAPRGLPPPRPIPCESLEYLVRWWVEMVRRELGTLPSTCSGQ